MYWILKPPYQHNIQTLLHLSLQMFEVSSIVNLSNLLDKI